MFPCSIILFHLLENNFIKTFSLMEHLLYGYVYKSIINYCEVNLFFWDAVNRNGNLEMCLLLSNWFLSKIELNLFFSLINYVFFHTILTIGIDVCNKTSYIFFLICCGTFLCPCMWWCICDFSVVFFILLSELNFINTKPKYKNLLLWFSLLQFHMRIIYHQHFVFLETWLLYFPIFLIIFLNCNKKKL